MKRVVFAMLAFLAGGLAAQENVGVPALNDSRASSTRRSSTAGASVSALVSTSTAGTPDRCASAR